MNANWLPVNTNEVPEPRPGQCVNDSRTLPEVTLNFIKSHSLMDESVPAFYGLPLITHTSFKYIIIHYAAQMFRCCHHHWFYLYPPGISSQKWPSILKFEQPMEKPTTYLSLEQVL